MSSAEASLTAVRIAHSQEEGRWTAWTATIMIASFATLVQSYVAIKLFLLGLFLLTSAVSVFCGKTQIAVYGRLIWFYVWVSMAGVAWAFVGLLHPANHVQGVLEALRLYVVWSAAFLVLYTLLKSGQSLKVMHRAIVLAGILIPLINFVGMYDQFTGLGLISEGIREELDMQAAFGDGWTQITSQNIDVMFLIAPYLLSLQFRTDAGKANSLLTKLALALSLILVVVSGRRALWIVVALTPGIILALSKLAVSQGLLTTGKKRFLVACTTAGVAVLAALLLFPKTGQDVGSIDRLREAFSAEDYRTIQKPYLIEGFLQSPVFGSGFGAAARFIRDDQKPWAGYELTYYQMLFNLGVVGMTVLVTLFSLYFIAVVRLLRRFQDHSIVPFALLVGYCAFFVGAYSNRYFGSFDLLFFVGLLPYLSTFEFGFDWPQSKAEVPA